MMPKQGTAVEGQTGDSQGAQTVDAAMRVLDVLEQDGSGMSAAEISRAIDRSRGATYRILGSLLDAGLVAREDSKYVLGPRLLQLARRVQQQFRLVAVATPFITELRDRFSETTFISIIRGHYILTIDEAVALHPLRFSRGVGAADPIHTGATGRALLATLSPAQRDALYQQLDFRRYTPLTITDVEELRRAVQTVEEQGYAISFGEYVPGVTSLACPIYSSHGGPGAAITILGPQQRFTESQAYKALPSLKDAAAAISEKI